MWLEPSVSLRRADLNALRQLGVERKRATEELLRPIGCWHQALPLSPAETELDDRTEVLLQLQDDSSLTEIVTEMLRLGNDRQSLAWLQEDTATCLLKVIQPPHYTLLRATDSADGPTAFVSPAPRVWVEYGFHHPFAQALHPADNLWLLIRSDQSWQWIESPAMIDVYQALDFDVSSDVVMLTSDGEPARIRVPVGLRAASSSDAAEFWVLQRDALSQIETLVRGSDDELLARLSFAVAESPNPSHGGPTVVLRTRPSPLPPPVLVLGLDALACRPYQRIPNLFLPVGTRLHPPLRRDAVIRLFASNSDQVHWLAPDGDHAFVPHSIADAAFRPLTDWIDYVVDHHDEPLKAWIASHQFDFESFVCSDDQPLRQPLPRRRNPSDVETPERDSEREQPPGESSTLVAKRKRRSPKAEPTESDARSNLPKQDETQRQLRQLESDYQDCDEPLEGPTRTDLWFRMGELNARLHHPQDTTICFANGIWNLAIDQHAMLANRARQWLSTEQECADSGPLDEAALVDRLTDARWQGAHSGWIAAQVVAEASDPHKQTRLIASHLPEVIDYLVRQESRLPVRVAWLAWWALYRISGNDVLMLARARDRLLERLFQRGLAPEFDLPAFLRNTATGESERFRVLRDRFDEIQQRVAEWVIEPELSPSSQTKRYVDLIFAYGWARLGDSTRCHQCWSEAEKGLGRADPVHRWLLQAYQQRIQQALNGSPLEGSLSPELMEQLDSMDRGQKYLIDRLRQWSPILEPHAEVRPFENFLHRFADDLSRELAELPSIGDPEELRQRLDHLLDQHPSTSDRVRILPEALQIAPRLGERYAMRLLDRVRPTLDDCNQTVDRVALLPRAILIAAHYGHLDRVQGLVDVLESSLPALIQQYLELSLTDRQQTEAIETLLSQSFRGMRRLGMRDEIGRIYGRIAERLAATGGSKQDTIRSDRLLLSVAGGWYFFGQLDAARDLSQRIFQRLRGEAKLDPATTRLLCAYLEAVSSAPVEEAIQRVLEVFATDRGGATTIANVASSLTTDSHFSISHLGVVEAAVMSLLSDDYSLSAETRRWLDEDEYLVRRRIHRDTQQAAG